MRAKLPPTDDRLRPDMRLFEHGYFQEVSSCGPVAWQALCFQKHVQGLRICTFLQLA